MKTWLIAALLTLSSLLAGCATSTVTSDVTTFHDWPDQLPDKSYVFERTKAQNDSLEYRAYEDMVRAELNRLGFNDAPAGTRPALKVSFDYRISGRDVREVYPVVVDPYPWGPMWPGPPWRGYYSPFYDPFWYGPPIVEQRVSQYELFTRHLHIDISRVDNGKKLYETTVVSEGRNGSLAAVMPYMVRSAFMNFPGKSGVPQRVELKMEK